MTVRKEVSGWAWLWQGDCSVGSWDVSRRLSPNPVLCVTLCSVPAQEHPASLRAFPAPHALLWELAPSSCRSFIPKALPVLRTQEDPRHTYGKTSQEATPHMNLWFCSLPHPPLPPPTLRKPDVQTVNRGKKKIPPRPLETRLVWLGFESAQWLLHVVYL